MSLPKPLRIASWLAAAIAALAVAWLVWIAAHIAW